MSACKLSALYKVVSADLHVSTCLKTVHVESCKVTDDDHYVWITLQIMLTFKSMCLCRGGFWQAQIELTPAIRHLVSCDNCLGTLG